MNEFVTPHLRSVLKIYQDSATKSLQGPGSSIVVHSSAMKKEIPSPDLRDEPITPAAPPLQPPEIPQPVLSAADTGRSILYETILEGKQIGCFLLGGEMRLCFPQVLNNVLMNFGLDQINRIFDELRIFCSQCSPDQLNQFKAAKILPEDVNTSGLITRTNAERLCSALLHRGERAPIVKNAISFRVIHRCFGKCEGICTPEFYSYKDPACIRCIECNLMFSPQRFVCHVHSNQENSTLHWGFDSNNWRAYLQVSEDEENREKYTALLDELREREQRDMVIALNIQRDDSNLKRKAPEMEESLPRPPCKKEPLDIPLKKAKLFEDKFIMDYQYQVLLAQYQRQNSYHGFRPWTSSIGASTKHLPHLPFVSTALPYLSQEPPILQNPERVVRNSEREHYEQSYQPNVALAPRNGSKTTSSVGIKIDTEHGEYENGERDRSLAMDVKIKEERPQTPSDESHSPESCITSGATTVGNIQNNIDSTPNSVPPVSPEGQSASSNEITSSTSPVPAAATTTFDKLNDSTHSPKTVTPPVNNHHINQLMNRSHHKDIDNHHHHLHLHNNHHNHHRAQQNGTFENRPYHYHPYNRYKLNGLSSEFDLSTDTDDDSLVGEADSSNHPSPLDIANEALKDIDAKDRERVLNIIKMLLHENLQLSLKNTSLLRELQRKDDEIADLMQTNRHTHTTSNSFLTSSRSDTSSNNSNDESTKYPSESDELKVADETIISKKNDERSDDEKDMDKTKTITKCNDSVTIHVLDSTKAKADEPSQHEFNKPDSAPATITVTKTVIEVGTPKVNDTADIKSATITNGTTTTNTISSTKFGCAKSETEVIRMPLKKSVRRTPTEDTTTAATVVVMQPHKLRDEARDKSCDKLDKISRNFEKNLRSLSPPPTANLVTAKATE
ncbi:ski oncogene [Contarinia nasturtii]|uniref:ski oncogene n=1 Tax=Contarinia nasturtii TaxID=265458 RepID=UPI0012D3E2EF|nr:ski oncogene [Contarinia nasturtii]